LKICDETDAEDSCLQSGQCPPEKPGGAGRPNIFLLPDPTPGLRRAALPALQLKAIFNARFHQGNF